jgi:opacity protein-like surface antigen
MRRTNLVVVVALLVLGALPARAQSSGRGFLFREPLFSVTLRGGWAGANAKSDLFAFTTDQLTLNKGDFSSGSFGVDGAFRLRTGTHAVLSLGAASAKKRSEFRDFVDNNELPIEQTTSFTRVPITLSVKQYLMSTGRPIGRFAWIPARVSPFVGAGGGGMYYRFHQTGDFIDFQTMDVFPSQFESSGWTSTAHVMAGVDYSLAARFALTLEARYLWSSAPLSNDFSGFNKLDLSGLATSAGLTVRF